MSNLVSKICCKLILGCLEKKKGERKGEIHGKERKQREFIHVKYFLLDKKMYNK